MERGVWEGSVCGHDCAYKTSGASRVDGVPWNWPGQLQQRGSMDCNAQAPGRRLRACRAMPASQASSRTTPAWLWAVAVPSSTGHELGTLCAFTRARWAGPWQSKEGDPLQ